MPKAKPADPLTVVQKAVAEAVAATKAQQDTCMNIAQVEFEKVRKGALESLEATSEAQHKGLDATLTAARTAIDGLDQVAALSRDLLKNAADAPAAQLEKVLLARTPADAVTAQVEILRASQKQAADYVGAVTKLVYDVAKDAVKPAQELAAANLNRLSKAAAA